MTTAIRRSRFTPKQLLGTSAVLGSLVVAAAICAMMVGPRWVSVLNAFAEPDSAAADIVFRIRLPWVILAACTGASLGVVGVAFQALLRNPLADPFVLGISGGAAVGIVTALTLGAQVGLVVGPLGHASWGIAGAAGATLLVWSLSRVRGEMDSYTMLLAGVVVNAMFGAIVMFLISQSGPDEVHSTAMWLMGILDVFQIRPSLLWTACAVSGGALAVLCCFGKQLNAMSLGDDVARQLGVNAQGTRLAVFLLGAIIVGAVTTVAGPIGFVGLLVPHLLRWILGPDHRLLLPASALGGALFLLVAGTVARVAFAWTHNLIPVGVVTACVGGPFFLWILRRRGKVYGDA
jgi:iron complex transport system permease protein